ncbi:hypothetical protein, partial [Myroides marinus]|uniref:hypothetical protein n=1 Tax=Myroides marinus TaxID=703342 RepID=UPI0025772029
CYSFMEHPVPDEFIIGNAAKLRIDANGLNSCKQMRTESLNIIVNFQYFKLYSSTSRLKVFNIKNL